MQMNTVQSEAARAKWEGETSLMLADLMRRIPDFDWEGKINPFCKQFNMKNSFDRAMLFYFAEKGSRMEQEIEKAREGIMLEARAKKSSLMPVGYGSAPELGEPEDIETARRGALSFLRGKK